MFAPPHPAAPVNRSGGWNCDLALVPPERLLAASLPVTTAGALRFCALMEFKIHDDYWGVGGRGRPPSKYLAHLEMDCDKLVRLLRAEVAPIAWACAFAYGDPLFLAGFVEAQEARHPGLRVRLVRA